MEKLVEGIKSIDIGKTAEKELSYRIDVSKPEEWKKHLEEEGYVVVTNVLKTDEVDQAKSMVWDWLESLGSEIKRDDPVSWKDENWPGASNLGFLQSHGGGQSASAWYVRALPAVKGLFETIWKTNELLTSMDTFICWRPWDKMYVEDELWLPKVERLHCDQSPLNKKGFHCVQGMVVLLPVNEKTGGLQVVPKTNTDQVQNYLTSVYGGYGDWCQLSPTDKFIGTGQLLISNPGDCILWDSRTIHGGWVPKTPQSNNNDKSVDLVRLALTVCMTPRSKATEKVLEQRKKAFENGWTLTHWPHEFIRHGFGDYDGKNISSKYSPITLTEAQKGLL